MIGGGAAGMMCAYTAACGGAQVVLLEPNRQLGRKVRITGKGRCNVTNDCDVKTFLQHIPGEGRFLYSALSRFSPQDTMAFFESLGVPLKVERGSRVCLGEQVKPACAGGRQAAGDWRQWPSRGARRRPSVHRS